MNESERVIRALYGIASDYAAGFETQVHRLLSLGCDRFGLEIGILSRVEGTLYEIVGVVAPRAVGLEPGMQFPLDETYCSRTLAAPTPQGFEHVGESALRSHPAYGKLQLEAYLGTRVVAGGEVYGTINFSSPTPRTPRFNENDYDCAQLMGSWLGAEIQRRRTEDALRETSRRLEHLTRVDPLTQLLNRRGADDTLERTLGRARRGREPVVALLIDLDDFKLVNDEHGYLCGDSLLVDVADAIRAAVRPADLVARLGGDEFLVVLNGATEKTGLVAAQRILEAVRRAPVLGKHGPVRATASIGVAGLDPHAGGVQDVLGACQEALRTSKVTGKDRVSV